MSQFRYTGRDGGLHAGEVANVDLAGEYAPTAACDQVDGGNKIVRVSERIGHGVDLLTDIDGNDVGALLGQAQCVGAALPTCGACDEATLPFSRVIWCVRPISQWLRIALRESAT